MKKLLATALVGTILAGLGGAAVQADSPVPKKGRKDPGAAARKGAKKDPEAVFRKRDKNGDGALTLDEFQGKKDPAKVQARFQRLDKDSDGKVTLAEFAAARTSRKKQAK
jgi:Ca2+-binding EF-hand superfamily protein